MKKPRDFFILIHFFIQIQKIYMLQENSQQLPASQPQNCKIFDRYYGNRKKLGVVQGHVVWMSNQYNSKTNPEGMVNFGTSVNTVIAKTTIKYLPQFIKIQDCTYPDPRGYDQYNKKVSEGTQFAWDETFSFNNIYSILSLFCYKYKNVFIVGNCEKINFEIILDHSDSRIINSGQKADLVIFFDHNQEIVQNIQQKNSESVKLFILSSKKQLDLLDINKNNHAFAYQYALKQGLNLAVLHTKETSIKKHIHDEWVFSTTSTVTRRASLDPDLKIQIQQTGTQTVRKMIEIDSKVIVPEKNIQFTLGATSGLDVITRALFKNKSLCVDAPYYVRFDFDMTHNGTKVINKPILPGSKILDRIRESQSQGCVGYIICNPKNPVGTIMEPQQVDQICQYVKDLPNFHLVFDEVYLNTCFGRQTKSASGYAIQYPNIHVVRGMAKDFGLCGFKVGFAISSNPIVMKKFEEWKPIISHHPLTISVVNSMLKKSNYGTEIFEAGKQLLRDYFEIVCSALDKENISYEKPQAGCFIFPNFKNFMREYTLDQEYVLWKKLFYKYRLNMPNGANYHTTEHGYFRVCPIVDKQILREGLKRLFAALKDKQEE